MDDKLIDQKAAQLNQYKVALNKSHWALMAERIQKELIS